MLPIVAYNFSSGNRERMKSTINTARVYGLGISLLSLALFQAFAAPLVRIFLSTSAGDVEAALITIGFAVIFIRIRCLASPFQSLNYHTSYCMQAMGDGFGTLLHAVVRELVFYIPFMFLLDRIAGENGLASALPVGEACGAAFALLLLRVRMGRKSN